MAKRKSKKFSMWKGNTRKFDGKQYKFFAGYGKSSAKKKAKELRKMGFNVRIVKHQSDDYPGYRYDVYNRRKSK